MMKLFLRVTAIAMTITGGHILCNALFGCIDEMFLPCCFLSGGLLMLVSHILSIRFKEASAVRIAAYERRREKRFQEIDDHNLALKYETLRSELLEERGQD